MVFKRIGILTGGGDVPGLNTCIKAIVTKALEEGMEVLGVRRGWAGLLHCDPENEESVRAHILPLTFPLVRTIDRSGGTFLHTSRTNPARVAPAELPPFLRSEPGESPLDCTPHVLRVVSRLGMEALVAIGGDDTLSYGLRLHREGVPVVAVPKTMDNDVFGTDYCIGFSTAVTRSVDYITQLRTSIGSHERIGVVELFGRNSGETSLMAAYLAGVDRAVISEVPFDPERLARLLAADRLRSPSHYAVMTISEGARMLEGGVSEHGPEDPYGHKKLGGIGFLTAQEIRRITGINTLYQQLAYLMRSGPPDSLDRMVATNFGILAVELLLAGETGRLVVLKEGRYGHEELEVVAAGTRRVDVERFYDLQQYRPKVRQVLGKPMFLY